MAQVAQSGATSFAGRWGAAKESCADAIRLNGAGIATDDRMTKKCSAGASVMVALVQFACTQKDLTDLDPVSGSGGSGGSSPEAGAAGASGSAGSGGSMEAGLPDAAPTRFRAVLDGDTVILSALEPVWVLSCEDNPRLVQRVDDAWTLLRDERPEAFNLHHAAHYLDGSYHSDCALSLGCDVLLCSQFSEKQDELEDFRVRLVAREYVQVGQRSALRCDAADAGSELDAGSDAGTRLVPDLESRMPSGPLGVRVRYFEDPCETEPITVDVPVE